MEHVSEDRAAVPLPPPLIFLACLGVAGGLEIVFPAHPDSWAWTPRIIASGILSIISGLVATGAFIALLKNKTPVDPSKPTMRIVRAGSYRFSRNPMYLSLLLLLTGVTVLICSLWLLLAIPVLFIVFEIFVVRREEIYLTRKFGDEYLRYKASVRRWI